ncbi:MAG: NnrS family protein, partial [Flavobacteriaceae bacterium]|nr:NnrS family protein [Flavobacteriaceae bacterium]
MNTTSFLSIGFRPFFLLTAIIGAIYPLLWILMMNGSLSLSLNTSNLFWHAHEMTFGFTGAVLAGFLFTASSNWTRSKPYQGKFLVFLICCWLIARLSFFLNLSGVINIILLNLFFPSFTLMLFLKLRKHPKQRNVFIPLLLILTCASILHSFGYHFSHYNIEVMGKDIATSLIRLLLMLMAGRLIPFFTRAKIEGLNVDVPQWLNAISLVPLLLLIIPLPDFFSDNITLVLLLWALVTNALRFILWKPLRTVRIPILFILHIGTLLILLSIGQEIIGIFNPHMHFSQATLHMLLLGGLGTIVLAFITRVSLGHTGRVIKANKWMILAFLSIVISSIFRAIIPIIFPKLYTLSL